MNYFFIISSLLLLCVQLTKTSCEVRPCNQLISHFYFSNNYTVIEIQTLKEIDLKAGDNREKFEKIKSIAANNNNYLEQIKSFMEWQSKKVLNEKRGIIASIKEYLNIIRYPFSNKKRKTLAFDNALRTYSNTCLIITELFDIEKVSIKGLKPLIETYKEAESSEKVISKFITEVLVEINNRIKGVTRWNQQNFLKDNIFFGFSLIPITKYYINVIPKTSSNNRLFYMTDIFKKIFTKINTIIYWHYILKKIIPETDLNFKVYEYFTLNGNSEKITLTELFKKINSHFNLITNELNNYLNSIKSNLINKKGPNTYEASIEKEIVEALIKWINSNNKTITNIFPEKQVVDPKPKIEPVCTCPYLQTDFPIINFKTIKEDKQYLKKLTKHIELLSKTITIQHKKTGKIQDSISTELLQIYLIKEKLNLNRTHEEENTLKIITDFKNGQFLKKCQLITSKINNNWNKQLPPQTSYLSWFSGPIKKRWITNHYFFGFSLMKNPAKTSDLNRYTYMITQFEEIFEMINEMIPFVKKDGFYSFQSELESLISALEAYQNSFFGNDKLMSDYKNSFKKSFLSEIARFEQGQHALQVGIECAIVDRIIAWIKENISIIQNMKKTSVTRSFSSSSNSKEEYYDVEKDLNDDESLLEQKTLNLINLK